MSDQDVIARLRGLPPELGAPVDRFERVSHRVRRRRARIVAGAALALCVALAAPFGLNSLDGTPDNAVDPAAPTVSYAPGELASVMQDEAQRTLGPSLGALPPATVVAYPENGVDKLRPEQYDQAQFMSLRFDLSPTHQVDFRVAQAGSEAEGNPDDYCEAGLRDRLYMSCEVTQVDGVTVIVSTSTVVRLRRDMFAIVRPGEPMPIGVEKNPTYYLQRTAKAIRTETMVSSVQEATVLNKGQDPAQAVETAFDVPASALSILAANPAVAI